MTLGWVTTDSYILVIIDCIRGMRIRVTDILEMLALNVEVSEILADFPDLETEDIQACLLLSRFCCKN